MRTNEIRDIIIDALKKQKSTAVIEINGHHFAAADIAVADKDGNSQAYRIAVIPYNRQNAAI